MPRKRPRRGIGGLSHFQKRVVRVEGRKEQQVLRTTTIVLLSTSKLALEPGLGANSLFFLFQFSVFSLRLVVIPGRCRCHGLRKPMPRQA